MRPVTVVRKIKKRNRHAFAQNVVMCFRETGGTVSMRIGEPNMSKSCHIGSLGSPLNRSNPGEVDHP